MATKKAPKLVFDESPNLAVGQTLTPVPMNQVYVPYGATNPNGWRVGASYTPSYSAAVFGPGGVQYRLPSIPGAPFCQASCVSISGARVAGYTFVNGSTPVALRWLAGSDQVPDQLTIAGVRAMPTAVADDGTVALYAFVGMGLQWWFWKPDGTVVASDLQAAGVDYVFTLDNSGVDTYSLKAARMYGGPQTGFLITGYRLP